MNGCSKDTATLGAALVAVEPLLNIAAGTGLDYFGARYYSGAQGRFTSPDAPFADQHPQDPQSWNLYSYVRNNPSRLIDETGRGATETSVRVAYKYFLKLARQRGVDRAWALERRLVKAGMGTVEWTAAEKAELLATGRVKGYAGHHINSVASNSLEMAEDPRNIKFTKSHLEEHGGNWANQTAGELIDRLAKMGGPALLVFFTVFDQKLAEYTSDNECPMCSDPNSWMALINPANNLVEGPALMEAFVAAKNRQKQEAEKHKNRAKETPISGFCSAEFQNCGH